MRDGKSNVAVPSNYLGRPAEPSPAPTRRDASISVSDYSPKHTHLLNVGGTGRASLPSCTAARTGEMCVDLGHVVVPRVLKTTHVCVSAGNQRRGIGNRGSSQ
jgi:hypothetical protein